VYPQALHFSIPRSRLLNRLKHACSFLLHFGTCLKTSNQLSIKTQTRNESQTVSYFRFLFYFVQYSPHVVTICINITHLCIGYILCDGPILTLRRLMSYIYMEHPFLMFLDHTQRRSTVGRTPLDE